MNKLYFIFSCLGLAGGLSIALALLGDALVCLGFYSLSMQIAATHPILGYLTLGFGYFGCFAGIIMPSLGLGMFGLIGMLNLM